MGKFYFVKYPPDTVSSSLHSATIAYDGIEIMDPETTTDTCMWIHISIMRVYAIVSDDDLLGRACEGMYARVGARLA